MRSKTIWLVLGVALLAFWAGSRFGGQGQQPVVDAQRPSAEAPVLAPTSGTGDADRKLPAKTWPQRDDNAGYRSPTSTYPDFLPPQAHDTLRLIERDGPFPHRQDGSVFQNRERLLPQQPHGYYREYTVKTPGSRDRGARRIVTGGQPPREYFYTEDHYRSFRRFSLDTASQTQGYSR